MGLDSLLAHDKLGGDEPVAQSFDEKAEHLALALAQAEMAAWPPLAVAEVRGALGDACRHGGVDDHLPVGHERNVVGKLRSGERLQQVPRNTEPQSLEQAPLVAVI